MNFVTILGLIGVTLVISVGKIFESTREWLKGFTHRLNPLRFVGEVMGCTMCAGWWVGFAWGLYAGQAAPAAVVSGGVVSLTAYVTDEGLAIVAAIGMKLVRSVRGNGGQQVPVESIAPMKRRPIVPDEEESLTEAEAHQAAESDEDKT